jgi:hypothetical protein
VNVVIYALSKKSMGSLDYIQEVRRPLIKELHGLLDERVNFEIWKLGALLAYFQAKLNLVDRIKVAQMKDEQLCKIWDELEFGRAPSFVVYKDGVLRFGFKVCVSKVDDLKWDVMVEVHQTIYIVHPGSNKMYRLERVFLVEWNEEGHCWVCISMLDLLEG